MRDRGSPIFLELWRRVYDGQWSGERWVWSRNGTSQRQTLECGQIELESELGKGTKLRTVLRFPKKSNQYVFTSLFSSWFMCDNDVFRGWTKGWDEYQLTESKSWIQPCQGCVNYIKSFCPTEAMRVIDGTVSILNDLCIGFVVSVCDLAVKRRSLWMMTIGELIRTLGSGVAVTDPTFYSQFGSYWAPSDVEVAMYHWNTQLLVREVEDTYDVCAMAAARDRGRGNYADFLTTRPWCASYNFNFRKLLGRVLLVWAGSGWWPFGAKKQERQTLWALFSLSARLTMRLEIQ